MGWCVVEKCHQLLTFGVGPYLQLVCLILGHLYRVSAIFHLVHELIIVSRISNYVPVTQTTGLVATRTTTASEYRWHLEATIFILYVAFILFLAIAYTLFCELRDLTLLIPVDHSLV